MSELWIIIMCYIAMAAIIAMALATPYLVSLSSCS